MRVLVVEDHPLFRAALAQAIGRALAPTAVAEAASLAEAERELAAHPETELLTLDLGLPDGDGLAALAALRCQFPAVACVVVSARSEPALIRRALAHGAQGFIPKSATLAEIEEALRAVGRLETWVPPGLRAAVAAARDREEEALAARLRGLTAQQFRVLALIGQGLLNKQIAERLGIAERTVKAHVGEILAKLGARNRTQAGLIYQRLALAPPGG
ncbi:MAG: response regulator transcription factor [Xanthomonadales bacterium]|nr:response regulator transcription factor [Xanthomonadales bacterium]